MLLSAQNILADIQDGVSQSVVISAMRSSIFNTTDELIKIGKLLQSATPENSELIRKELIKGMTQIKDFHKELIKEKLADFEDVQVAALDVLRREFNTFAQVVIWFLERIEQKNSIIDGLQDDYTIPTTMTDDDIPAVSILGFWEVLSAKIFNCVVNELAKVQSQKVQAACLDTSTLVSNIVGDKNVFERISNTFGRRISRMVQDETIAIIPWYIAGLPGGIEKAVGRGYSDATAAAVAVWSHRIWFETELHIQKSVKGLLSIDPKIAHQDVAPMLISQVNHITAREITWWAEAKLLHAQTLRKEVLEAGISIYLYDPFDTSSKGTIISKEWTEDKWVQFIGMKDIVQFSVSSTRMGWNWILAAIFGKVKDFASVDAVSTSETEVSFTISWVCWTDENVANILWAIRDTLDIRVDTKTEFIKASKKTLLYCIGQNISHEVGILNKATTALSEAGVNVEMASQWALERAMIFSVDRLDAQKAANSLHTALIWQVF